MSANSMRRRPAAHAVPESSSAPVFRRPAAGETAGGRPCKKAKRDQPPAVAAHARKGTAAAASGVRRAICKRQGHWVLATGTSKSRGRRSGTYDFNPATSLLSTGDGDQAATIVIRPIADTFLQCPVGQESLPVVSVVSSEVMFEIQQPENAGAFFVLPSQFNSAEYPDHLTPVSAIADYRWDRTAGPRGQLAVDPTVGQFLLDNAACAGRKDGIEAVGSVLEAVRGDGHEGFVLTNGYLQVPRLNPTQAASAASSFERNLYKLHTIAARDVRVCGLAPSLANWNESEQRVSVVYASAVPVGAYLNFAGRGSSEERAQQKISSLALRGAYFGALRLALESRVSGATDLTRVFIMPVGGGVFNNSFADIARSLSEALELANAVCVKGNLMNYLDVRLLAWEGKPQEAAEFKRHLRRYGKLKTT